MRRWILCVLALFPGWLADPVGPSSAAEPGPHPREQALAADLAMAGRVDLRLSEQWREAGVVPAERSGDAEFFRRVHLDLTGHIPTVAAVREFLDETSPAKRVEAVQHLLDSPSFAAHLAAVWRNRLLPRGIEPSELESAVGLEEWLRGQFLRNLRYDQLVAEFLVAQGDGRAGPALYYTSLELKPEKLAASSARIFLGVQLECAECHDHPFDRWTQRDFWSYAAFFAQLEQPDAMGMGLARIRDRREGEVYLPHTTDPVAPRFPGGRPVPEGEYGTRRSQLAIWMASRDNPYLARSAVNSVWAQLFGRGLVHPVDDLSEQNRPSHPELLDELAEYLVEVDFDLKRLFRVLTLSDGYQLTSRTGEATDTETPPELFARMPVKTLPPEQLFDCIERAAGGFAEPWGVSGMAAHRLRDPRRLAFLARMPTTQRDATEFEAGLPQALLLMNGPVITEATHPHRSRLLQGLAAPFWTMDQQIEILHLATVSRYPTAAEMVRSRHYLESLERGRRQDGLSDLLWALLNSAEFMLNY